MEPRSRFSSQLSTRFLETTIIFTHAHDYQHDVNSTIGKPTPGDIVTAHPNHSRKQRTEDKVFVGIRMVSRIIPKWEIDHYRNDSFVFGGYICPLYRALCTALHLSIEIHPRLTLCLHTITHKPILLFCQAAYSQLADPLREHQKCHDIVLGQCDPTGNVR